MKTSIPSTRLILNILMCGLFSTQALAFEVKCDNGKEITPAELLMAIYVNHQTNSLGYKIIDDSLTKADMEKLLLKGKKEHNGSVNAIDNKKLPIRLNFSHWPNFDDEPVKNFDEANAGYQFNDEDPLSLYKEKTFADIVDRYCHGLIDIAAPLTKDRIKKGIWATYEKFRSLKPDTKNAQSGPGEPEETLLLAIEHLQKLPHTMNHLTAIDLGCGEGRDTLKLLEKGFKVHAMDSNKTALEKLESYAQDAKLEEKLDIRHSSFADLDLKKVINGGSVQLLNASWSLPYSDAHFNRAMSQIKKTLDKGGVFAGTFFGENDDLKNEMDTRLLTNQEMEKLFPKPEYERIHWKSKEYNDKRVDGSTKHWHVWHVVVKKKRTQNKD